MTVFLFFFFFPKFRGENRPWRAKFYFERETIEGISTSRINKCCSKQTHTHTHTTFPDGEVSPLGNWLPRDRVWDRLRFHSSLHFDLEHENVLEAVQALRFCANSRNPRVSFRIFLVFSCASSFPANCAAAHKRTLVFRTSARKKETD